MTRDFPADLALKFARKRVGSFRARGVVLKGLVSEDDLVQEGLLRAWRDWGKYDPAKSKPSTWLWLAVWRGISQALRDAGPLLPNLDVRHHLQEGHEGWVSKLKSREEGWQDRVDGRELLEMVPERDREVLLAGFERGGMKALSLRKGRTMAWASWKRGTVLENLKKKVRDA